MGEKVANVAALVIGLATVAVIFKSRQSAGVIGSFGRAFANVISAAQRG